MTMPVALRCERSETSKGDGPSASALSFEGRGACHRAGHFGPSPLAATFRMTVRQS